MTGSRFGLGIDPRWIRPSAPILTAGICLIALAGCDEETPTGLVFSHKEHLNRGFDCAVCHFARSYHEPSRPAKDVCGFCHDVGGREEEPDRSCAQCHSRVDLTVSAVPRDAYADVHFDHEVHTRAGVACAECHVGQDRAVDFHGIVFTGMRDCQECHTKRGVEQDCSTCHAFWREDVLPASHDPLWLETHGREAAVEFESRCDYCHTSKSFCHDCHMAEPARSHTPFFRNRGHGFHAENDRMSCLPCHQQDFCMQCHDVDSGVKPASHVAGFGGRPPYLHCNTCHFPAGEAAGCNTCHTAGRIAAAHRDALDDRGVPNVPEFVLMVSTDCLGGCHPYGAIPMNHPAATLMNEECLICHLR